MFKYYERIIVYQSSTWETGADAFKNICDDIGFTAYDDASVNKSISELTEADCYLKVSLQQEDGVTFQSIIEKLGEVTNSDVYTHNNIVYFIHWIKGDGGKTVWDRGTKAGGGPCSGLAPAGRGRSPR